MKLSTIDLFCHGGLHFFEQVRGENKVVERVVFGGENLLFRACPSDFSLVDQHNVRPDFHHGVHVVCVHHRGDAILGSDVLYQAVDDERCYGVQTRVWLVAKEVFRVQCDGARNGTRFCIPPEISDGARW